MTNFTDCRHGFEITFEFAKENPFFYNCNLVKKYMFGWCLEKDEVTSDTAGIEKNIL